MTSSLTANLRWALEGHRLGLISIEVFIGKKIYFLEQHKTKADWMTSSLCVWSLYRYFSTLTNQAAAAQRPAQLVSKYRGVVCSGLASSYSFVRTINLLNKRVAS